MQTPRGQRRAVTDDTFATARAPAIPSAAFTPLRRASDFTRIPIGLPGARPGRAAVQDAVWSLDATGLDKDRGFHFACREMKGDGTLVARVTEVGGPLARAGLLLRSGSTMSAETRAVWVQLSEAGELRALWRQGLGASRVETHDQPSEPPSWLKLSRRGNTVQAFGSVNGRDWQRVAAVHFQHLPETLLAGLAACSGSDTETVTARFDHVRQASAPDTRARGPSDLTVRVAGPGRVRLAWQRCRGTLYHNVLRSLHPGGPYMRVAYGVDGPTFDDLQTASGFTYHYVVEAISHGQPSRRSNEVVLVAA